MVMEMSSRAQELSFSLSCPPSLLPWTQPGCRRAGEGPRTAVGEGGSLQGEQEAGQSAGSARLGPGVGIGPQREATHWHNPEEGASGISGLGRARGGGSRGSRQGTSSCKPLPVLSHLILILYQQVHWRSFAHFLDT